MKKPNKKTPAQTAQTGQETSAQTDPSLHALDPVDAHELHNSSPASALSAPSAPSALNNSATTRRGCKPFQPLPEFASCSREQLDYLHDLIRSKTYDEAQQEIWTSLGCRISTNRLQRYRQKIDLAAALEIAGEDTLPAVDQLNHLLAGRETNIPAAGILLIQQRALALAAAPKTSPTLLKDLFRIFTYEDRKNDNAHRGKIAEQREKTRLAAFEHQKQIDHHHARLAEQREQTRQQMADLAERAQNHRERLSSDRNSTETQDELTERANAIIAFGREFLRQEAASSCNADSLSASPGIQQPASKESNQQPEIINQK